MTKSGLALLGAASILGLSACATVEEPRAIASAEIAATTAPDLLAEGFQNPPNSARPRTWWHWMNGNITQEGIARDLEWMHRIGLGGFQNFDASLRTPQIVENRLVYMTPEWREAFRFATSEAARLDLEMAIAASPGWSETGGPWVAPEDGMKKLVWGETLIHEGESFSGLINAAPTTTGPFQAVQFEDELAAVSGGDPVAPPEASGRIAVLAFPVVAAALAAPQFTASDGSDVDGAPLLDNDMHSAYALPLTPDLSGSLSITYPADVTVRTLQLSMPGLARPFRSPPVLPVLEAQIDGDWREVAQLPLAATPTTFAFDPVTASKFRLRVAENTNAAASSLLEGVPGAAGIDIFGLGELNEIAIADLRLSSGQRVHRAEEKAGYGSVLDFYAIMSDDSAPVSLSLGDVIDLSDRVDASGTLDWTPPAGSDWMVLDLGWSLTGKTNHPAPAEATGLEVDKFDSAAVRRYLETYLGMYRETVGDDLMGERGLQALLTDSIEVGFANWTPQMEAEFTARRGYPLRPWLPALSGVVIGSEAETEGFLFDYRQTLAELLTDNHYATVAQVAHENGLILYGEALEDTRPALGDDLSMRRYADVPMAALWTYPRGGQMRTTLLGDMKGAASTSHVYGQNLVAAESMTAASSPWAFAPRDLKRFIDLEFAYGINRPVIHTSVHVPVEDKKPGLSLMIFGQYFNRNETWAEMAGPWVSYMSRSSYLLQQGHYFADIAYFRGEEAPLTAQFAEGVPEGLPTNYAYDFINAEMLHEAVSVENGMLQTLGGTQYRVMFLGPDARHMTWPTLQRLGELAEQGVTIVGNMPLSTPSRADNAEKFADLTREIWARDNVIDSDDPEAVLAGMGVGADFAYSGGSAGSEVLFLHRELDDGHIYFLTNRHDRTENVEARFRVTGYAPELWDAISGTSQPLSYMVNGDHTVIPLELGPDDATFVVFRKPSEAGAATHAVSEPGLFVELDQPWQVSFQEGRGAPASIALDRLAPLNLSEDEGVRYFSGVSTYSTDIMLPEFPAGQQVWLDLGTVADIAEVYLNGKYVGTSWFAPDRVNISAVAERGRNNLEIRVANRWMNRLIGDARPGAEPITFVAAPTYTPDAELRPSGLIGPVRLLVAD